MTVRTYSNEKSLVIGKFYGSVTHNDKIYSDMKIIVLEGDGVSLLGRNRLNEINKGILTKGVALIKLTNILRQ